MKRMLPLIAIVVVNYRGREDTLECLRSLTFLTYPQRRVYLIDQASEDGTPYAVRTQFPEVTVIKNPVNNGFAGGNNLGIRRALNEGADYVFLLNNDTTVAPDLLERLREGAEGDNDPGIVGPLVLLSEQPEIVWAAGGQMGPRGESRLLGEGMPLTEAERREWSPDFIVGCGMLVKRAVFEKVGLFDERYFLYYEEADFCAAARHAGFGIATVNTARMWHKVSRSAGTDSRRTLYYMRRNALLYLRRYRGKGAVVRGALASVRLMFSLARRGQWQRSRTVLQALIDYARGRFGAAPETV
jgi:GT2 family glycosyltransferase